MAPDSPTGRSGPHVFVLDVANPQLASDDDHHVRRVLRTRNGDPLTIGDGHGAWRTAVLTEGGVEPTGDVVVVPASTVRLTVAFALTKAHKPELAVQKLTEIGVHHIVPFVAERSVVRWDSERTEKNQRRLAKVAREASMQSRRVHLPVVEDVADFATVAQLNGAVLADLGGPELTTAHHTVLIGPEGGWSNTEREGLPTVGLAGHVLRAETASIVAGTLLVDRHRAS